MSARRRHRIAVAVVIAAAAALIPNLASAATPAPAASAAQGAELTISNGSPWVYMNGKSVNFHTDVRDLAWNPAGTKAVFVDSNGNLETANADGSGRVVAVKAPAGVAFSHPTWETSPSTVVGDYPGNNLIFTAAVKSFSELEWVPATGVNAKPYVLNGLNGSNWANAGANLTNIAQRKGSFVFDNTRTGDVYIADAYLRMQTTGLGRGSEAALSPNGDEVVFVRSVSGHDHLIEENVTNHAVTDLTPHATTNYTEPTFSSNGATIAFRAPNGTYTMSATGNHAATKVTGSVGLIAYRA